MDGEPKPSLISRIQDVVGGLLGRKKVHAVRPKTGANKVVDSKLEDLPFGTPAKDAAARADAAAKADNVTGSPKATHSRMVPLNEKRPIGKDQWRKIKETAKETDVADNIDHWQSKAGGAMAGTSFGNNSDGDESKRKRPSMVTQARITSNRLQALQVRMEKPSNDIDKMDEDDGSVPRGH